MNMKMIVAMINPHRLDDVKKALGDIDIQGMSVSEIKGFGRTGGRTDVFRGSAYHVDFVPKLKIEVVVADQQVHPVLDAIERSAKTGKIGDGKVFVLGVDEAMRIRTGERGEAAI
jgi:nitrogen regulatory protein P-II 1